MKKIIITGANGFLGSNVIKSLINSDTIIYAIVNKNVDCIKDLTSNNIKVYKSIDEINDEGIDVLYHFAWKGNSGEDRFDQKLQLDNVLYSCEVMNKAIKLRCKKFVFAGSVMEYESIGCVIDNRININKGYIYSTSKLTADMFLRTIASNGGITYISLIISNIYGPGEKSPRLVNTTIRKILNGEKTCFSTCVQLYDFIYITDAVNKIILLGEDENSYGSYYIGNPSPRPLKTFIEELGRVCGRESDLGIGELGETTQLINYDMIDTSKIEMEYNYINNVDFMSGIQKTREYIERECQ